VTDFPAAAWRKSSYSGNDHGMCVELAAVSGVIGVRDSKQRGDGPVLEFGRSEMSAFLGVLKAGSPDR
jgi:hypothetical protein